MMKTVALAAALCGAAVAEEAPAEDDGMGGWMKYAATAAIGFYIFIAVLKTMLTKALFSGGANFPVGFSAVSAVVSIFRTLPSSIDAFLSP